MLAVWAILVPAAHPFDGEIYFEKLFDSTWTPYPPGTIVLDRDHYSKQLRGGYMLLPTWCTAGIEIGHKISMFRPYIKVEALFDEIYDGGQPESVIYDFGFTINFGKMYFTASQVGWEPIVDHFGNSGQVYRSLKVGFKWGKK